VSLRLVNRLRCDWWSSMDAVFRSNFGRETRPGFLLKYAQFSRPCRRRRDHVPSRLILPVWLPRTPKFRRELPLCIVGKKWIFHSSSVQFYVLSCPRTRSTIAEISCLPVTCPRRCSQFAETSRKVAVAPKTERPPQRITLECPT